MNKNNPNSPIRNFGLDISKTIQIDSVRFSRNDPKDFTTKAREYLSSKIPTAVEIRFTATTKTKNGEEEIKAEKERFLAKINFTFAGIDKDVTSGTVNFAINSYVLYKIK